MQNSSTHIIFDNATEAQHYTKAEYSDYKFSILDQLDDIKRFDSSFYEFLLCYPEYPICNRWLQKESPIKYKETDNINIGYEPIDDFFQYFRGLMISNSLSSYLDGDNYGDNYGKNTWYYAVGVYKNYLDDYYIPGGMIDGKLNSFHYYELYMRVPNLRITCHISFYNRKTFIIYIYIILLNKK